MILCVCPNPAWDITHRIATLTRGESHSIRDVQERAGGEAVNVASVLRQFGQATNVMAPVGCSTAAVYAADLSDRGIPFTAVDSGVPVRRSVAVVTDRDTTMLNEAGNRLAPSVWEALLGEVEALAPSAEAIVVAGSLPPDTSTEVITRIVDIGHRTATPTVLDIRGPALVAALPHQPTVVTPNAEEARETTGIADVLGAAAALVAAGASTAVVSDGPGGAALVTAARRVRGIPARRIEGNATGAGDAMTAALSLSVARAGAADAVDWDDTLITAMAWAMAAVHSPVAGEVDPELAGTLHEQIRLEEIP